MSPKRWGIVIAGVLVMAGAGLLIGPDTPSDMPRTVTRDPEPLNDIEPRVSANLRQEVLTSRSERVVPPSTTEPSELTVLVTDDGGTPVAGERVVAMCLSGAVQPRVGWSSPAGSAVFSNLIPARYEIRGLRTDPVTCELRSGDAAQVTLRLGRGVDVTGRLQTATGDAVSEAAIFLAYPLPADRQEVGRTGADGTFSVRHAPMRSWLSGFADGLGASNLRVVGKGTEGSSVVLTIPIENVSVKGVVVDDGANPIKSAIVRLTASGTTQPSRHGVLETETGVDGRFEFANARGRFCDLEVDAAGWASTKASVDANETNIVVTLKRGATVSVQVCGRDGVPVTDARVMLWGENLPRRLHGRQTDDLGVRWHAVPSGRTIVSARTKSGRARQEIRLESGEERAVQLCIAGDRLVRGEVLVAGSRAAKWRVQIAGDEGIEGAITDEEGRFAVECEAPSILSLYRPREGTVPVKVFRNIDDWHSNPLVIRVSEEEARPLTLSGSVDAGGGTVVDVVLRQMTPMAQTRFANMSGTRWSMAGLAPARYRVTLRVDGCQKVCGEWDLREDLDLGVLHWPKTRPVKIGLVAGNTWCKTLRVRNEDGYVVTVATTEADGFARVALPVATYWVQARDAGLEQSEHRIDLGDGADAYTCVGQASPECGLVIERGPGRVVPGESTLTLYRAGGRVWRSPLWIYTKQARLRIALNPGWYRCVVQCATARTDVRLLLDPERDATLNLR